MLDGLNVLSSLGSLDIVLHGGLVHGGFGGGLVPGGFGGGLVPGGLVHGGLGGNFMRRPRRTITTSAFTASAAASTY